MCIAVAFQGASEILEGRCTTSDRREADELVDDRRDLAARGSAQGIQVSPANARQGLSVPLHTAAAKVLEELAPAAASPKPATASKKKPGK